MPTTVELYNDRAPSVDLTVYRKEVFNFLKTVSIKYDALVEALNAYVQRQGGVVDENDPSSWKYYKNIVGEYHPTDPPIYITSFDTQEKMLFSKENLAKSPRTLSSYSVGEDYYEELCQLYPNQTDLIKGIRYPLSDWRIAYSADNLTYLGGDETILENNERDSLIEQINKTLHFIKFRWDFPAAQVEPLYPWVFWGGIWYILTIALFAQRFENIRHNEVHSWHVWQYITSQGLSDYSDLLTFSQSMFLYRNLNYLNINRGKQSNLIILANNLLKEWSLTLYGRDVIQRTDIGSDQTLLYPDLVARVIETDNASQNPIPPSTVEDMIYKLIAVGDELPPEEIAPLQNAQRQERLLSDTTVNTYPTKVVEIAPVDRNKKYARQFDTYIYDSLIYAISTEQYKTVVEVPSRINQQVVLLSAKEVLLLFNYCMLKAYGAEPDIIPTTHKSALALKPFPVKLVERYNLPGMNVNIHAYTDVYDYTNGYFQMKYDQPTPKEFSQELLKGFETIVHQADLQRMNGNDRVGRIMRLISRNMLIIGDVRLNLTDRKTYPDWLNSRYDIKQQIIDPIETSTKDVKQLYLELASDLIDTLVPILSDFNKYGDYQVTDSSYQRIKQLFIQLTSYNITFVDDNTSSPDYFFLPQFWGSLENEQTSGDTIYGIWSGNISISEEMKDKLVEVIFDRLIDIDHESLSDESFGFLDIDGVGAEICKDHLEEVRYSETEFGSIIREDSIRKDSFTVTSPIPSMTLVFPEASTTPYQQYLQRQKQ